MEASVISDHANPDSKPQALGSICPAHSFLCLKAYLNFFYHIGYSPFGYKYVEATGTHVVLEASKARKAFCIVIQSLTAFVCLTLMRSTCPEGKFRENPIQLFSTVQSGLVFLYMPTLSHLLWTKSKNLGKIPQYCQQSLGKGSRWRSLFTKETVVPYILVGILAISNISQNYWFLKTSLVEVEDLSLSGFLRAGAGVLQYNLLQKANRTAVGLNEELSLAWGISTVLYAFLAEYTLVVIMVFDSTPFLTSLMIHGIAGNFSRVLQKKSQEYAEVLEQYAEYKDLLNEINDVTSAAALVNFLASVPFYPILLVQLLDGEETYLLTLIPLTISFCFISAEASRKFGEFKTWLLNLDSETMEKSGTKLTVLYIEATSSPLGLQAGNMFTVTYKTIGTGLSILSTYLIIVLQFPAGPKINGAT